MNLTREQAIERIRQSWEELLPRITEPAKKRQNGKTSYVCFCGHGKNGDGITFNPLSKDGNGLKCFSCDFSGDIIDFYEEHNGKDFNTAIQELSQMLGLTIMGNYSGNSPVISDISRAETSTAEPIHESEPAPEADYTEYYMQCVKRLSDKRAADYLKSRGISVETAAKYMVGFDPVADPSNAPGKVDAGYRPHPAARLIIPYSKSFYFGRDIDKASSYPKVNTKGGKNAVFNRKALQSDVYALFVSEAALDALSIIEAGAQAISINGVGNTSLLIEELKTLKNQSHKPILLVCLDNDKSGATATKKLSQMLSEIDWPFQVVDVNGRYKDANEYLVANPTEFRSTLKGVLDSVSYPDSVSLYLEQQFDDDRAELINRGKIPTGFGELDALAGGIYPGLYVVAGVSSLGKTTFCHQMADQIANYGNNVLYISLEQSRLELVSKSLARVMALHENKRTETPTSLQIRTDNRLDYVAAKDEYLHTVGNRMSIKEGNFGFGVDEVGKAIEEYIRRTNITPVVVIDYLQALQVTQLTDGNKYGSDAKTVLDGIVINLKKWSRLYAVPIILISSLNRSNYNNEINFSALNGSGCIEYTADVIWGLQFSFVEDERYSGKSDAEKMKLFDTERASKVRKVTLKCMKNRFGKGTFKCNFIYEPEKELFISVPKNGR